MQSKLFQLTFFFCSFHNTFFTTMWTLIFTTLSKCRTQFFCRALLWSVFVALNSIHLWEERSLFFFAPVLFCVQRVCVVDKVVCVFYIRTYWFYINSEMILKFKLILGFSNCALSVSILLNKLPKSLNTCFSYNFQFCNFFSVFFLVVWRRLVDLAYLYLAYLYMLIQNGC